MVEWLTMAVTSPFYGPGWILVCRMLVLVFFGQEDTSRENYAAGFILMQFHILFELC